MSDVIDGPKFAQQQFNRQKQNKGFCGKIGESHYLLYFTMDRTPEILGTLGDFRTFWEGDFLMMTLVPSIF